MPLDSSLERLAESRVPDAALRDRARMKIMNRIEPRTLTSLVSEVVPPQDAFLKLRSTLLQTLTPLSRSPKIHSVLKWTAAFAVFVLLLRTMPFVLLSSTQADTSVQILPTGEVSLFTGGVWRDLEGPEVIQSAVMIRTGEGGEATVILNDDGVFRLQEHTTFRLHSIDDRPEISPSGPTATLLRGTVWVLGLLPPVTPGVQIETVHGLISLNSGSTSITDDEKTLSVEVYDRGASLQDDKGTTLLVTGEKAKVANGKVTIATMPTAAFTNAWASRNLAQDAVHRTEIAKLQAERREKVAGIHPTSVLYPAKRIAEEVDVFFTLTHEGRTEKRVEQANTRLNEALTLIQDGEAEEASNQFDAYKESLLTLVSSEDDNLVKYLVQKQIADASTTIQTQEPDAITLFTNAVNEVGSVVPDADLKPRDIEGYVLVDKLAAANRILASTQDVEAAARIYAEVQPYLRDLLSEQDGVHPLLKKEAKYLLVSTSSLLKEVDTLSEDPLVIAMEKDIAEFLPPEQEALRATAQELDARVEAMFKRSMTDLRHPVSRANEIRRMLEELENDPDRGTLLRRFKNRLPPDFKEGQDLVEGAIKALGDELKQ